MFDRIVILNAFPVSAFMRGAHQASFYFERISLQELRRRIEEAKREGIEVISFVRHPATAQIIGIPPSSGNYEYKRGDVVYIIVLTNPQRGVEVTQVSEDDVEVFMVLEEE